MQTEISFDGILVFGVLVLVFFFIRILSVL